MPASPAFPFTFAMKRLSDAMEVPLKSNDMAMIKPAMTGSRLAFILRSSSCLKVRNGPELGASDTARLTETSYNPIHSLVPILPPGSDPSTIRANPCGSMICLAS